MAVGGREIGVGAGGGKGDEKKRGEEGRRGGGVYDISTYEREF